MSLWVIRIVFLILCTGAGWEVGQILPDAIFPPDVHNAARWWTLIGFGLGGVMIAIDEMLKGFSLRAFSAASFGLLLGTIIAFIFDYSGLFYKVDPDARQVIRLGLFISFGYIGMVLAMRSNKEDFYLIIPYVRFAPSRRSEEVQLLDTSAIIDGRFVDLVQTRFIEGVVVIPRFVLKELQQVADSSEPMKRARGRRGLETLTRLQQIKGIEIKFHEGDIADEPEVDAKLVLLAKTLDARLWTTDYNLSKIAELQSVRVVNINELANGLKPVILPGESLSIKIVREGKDKGQGIGYLNDGTMVVVNQANRLVGQQVEAQVLSLLQTTSGVIVFADLKMSPGRQEPPQQLGQGPEPK